MGYRDKTTIGGLSEKFRTTQWSEIFERKKQGDEKEIVEYLIQMYWKPVYCYLRYKGYSNEDSKDLTQDFFLEIVIQKNLIFKADSSKGRFRTFLLTALNHFIINVEEKKHAQKRSPKDRLFYLDQVDDINYDAWLSLPNPEMTFHYSWISSILEQVLIEVESQCNQEGLSVHWNLFYGRILQPILQAQTSPSIKELCVKYHIDESSKASNMIVTVKRRFQSTLRKYIRNTVSTDEQAKEEIQDFIRIFPDLAQD